MQSLPSLIAGPRSSIALIRAAAERRGVPAPPPKWRAKYAQPLRTPRHRPTYQEAALVDVHCDMPPRWPVGRRRGSGRRRQQGRAAAIRRWARAWAIDQLASCLRPQSPAAHSHASPRTPSLAQARTPQAAAATSASAPSAGAAAAAQQPTLLWYKHDLRLDDHPGWHQALAAAAAGAAGPVVPVFIFDPARYAALVLPPGGAEGARGGAGGGEAARCPQRTHGGMHAHRRNRQTRAAAHLEPPCLRPHLTAALCRALASLDRSLRQRGSALVLRTGAWEEQLPALAQELGAGSVVAEQEVEAGA